MESPSTPVVSSSGLGDGEIAAIVIIPLFFLIPILCICYVLYRNRQRSAMYRKSTADAAGRKHTIYDVSQTLHNLGYEPSTDWSQVGGTATATFRWITRCITIEHTIMLNVNEFGRATALQDAIYYESGCLSTQNQLLRALRKCLGADEQGQMQRLLRAMTTQRTETLLLPDYGIK